MIEELNCPVCSRTMEMREAKNGTRTFECRAYGAHGPAHNTTVIVPRPKEKKRA